MIFFLMVTYLREQKILEDTKIIAFLLDKKLKVLEKRSQRTSQEILKWVFFDNILYFLTKSK